MVSIACATATYLFTVIMYFTVRAASFVFRRTYKDFISRDVRQILIETHGVPQGALEFFESFKTNNFALFSKELTAYGNGLCVEFSFVKLHPDFWKV